MDELTVSALPESPAGLFGVYVHIPFCAARCDYCAFATFTDRHYLEARYLASVRAHICREVDRGMPLATSVFVGGGTPTQVNPVGLAELISTIPVVPGAEITVECNPDDVTAELFAIYRSAGVNRVSLGVQSTQRHVLTALGRTHDPESVQRSVALVRAANFESFNLDLIFGGAGESASDWQASVDDVIAWGVPHVSAYALTVEAGTPLADDSTRHPDEDDLADKYLAADATFHRAGLENYEISNWAIPGHECRHNWLYWVQGDYAAFGSGAHGHAGGRRWWNVRTPDRYIEQIEADLSAESASEILDDATRAYERIDLRLRTRLGIHSSDLSAQDLAEVGHLLTDHADGRLLLTPTGRLLANVVSLRLRGANR